MRYEMISADCHVDLCSLPSTLFTENASSAMRERMPYVADGPNGRRWTTKSGANLGHLPAATRRKIVCENAARLYGFAL